jgi:hypothetical protein
LKKNSTNKFVKSKSKNKKQEKEDNVDRSSSEDTNLKKNNVNKFSK